MTNLLTWLVADDQTTSVLNVASITVLIGGLILGALLAPRAFRARALEAEIHEKDAIIATRKEMADTREEEANIARAKSAELGGLLDSARSEAAAWQARYEEQSQYTAPAALDTITQLLKHGDREAERRHLEMLAALQHLRA